MTKSLSFILNGQPVTVEVDPRRSLVKVLREELGLTGTKEGCNQGHCGSCAVLMEGRAVLSCLLPVSRVAGKRLTTIEGIGNRENLHPLQIAFVQAGAVQCGFCTPGMIVAAKALLDRNPAPSRPEVARALRRHLCRCTGYVKILEAVLLAASALRGETDVRLPEGKCGVGDNAALIDGVTKVCGQALYAADWKKPAMGLARVLRSPYPYARILSVDTREAEAMPGVAAVVTARDVPGVNRTGPVIRDQPILAEEVVRYAGEGVAAVAAASEEVAEAALKKIVVAYESLRPVLDPFEALKRRAPRLHAEASSAAGSIKPAGYAAPLAPSSFGVDGNLLASRKIVKGDLEEGFAEAEVEFEAVFTTPFCEHAYLETEAGVSYYDDQGRLTLATGCQAPHYLLAELASVMGLPQEKARVIQTTTGGGFGGKIDMAGQGILALLAQKAGQPVKYVYSREESFLASVKRHPFFMVYRLGATREGRLTALRVKLVANTGAYASLGPGVLNRACIHATGPYHIPHVLIEGRLVYTNNPVASAMRGFGAPQVTFAMESMMDLMAEKLRLDPLEIRLMNAFQAGSTTATGQELKEAVTIKKSLQALKPFYQSWAARPSSRGIHRRGLGLSAMWFGIGKTSMDNRSQVILKLERDGRLSLLAAAADIGQGSRTILAQMVAQELGLSCEDIIVSEVDTALAPDADFTCASRQTYFSGGAARRAAQMLGEQILALAAQMLNTSKENLTFDRGYVKVKGQPGLSVSFKELAERGPLQADALFELPLTTSLDAATGQGIPYPTYTYGAQLAEVEVNVKNGQVKVLRMVAVQDVGRAINPKSVEGQMEGGILMGMGYALMEEFVPGKTVNFKEYRIPTFADVPEITCIFIEEPDPYGPYGAKGIGESALMPVAPAITNAIYNACGVRIKDLPAQPERVLAGWEKLAKAVPPP